MKKTLINILATGAIVTATGLGILNYNSNKSKINEFNPQTKTSILEDYSIENFSKVLGDNWTKLSPEEKDQSKEIWNRITPDERKEAYEIYAGNSKIIKEFEDVNYDLISEESKKKYAEDIPWINLQNPSKGDKTLLKYIGFSVSASQR